MFSVKFCKLELKVPVPVPSEVDGFKVVGVVATLLYTTPLAVTLAPPSLEILPPVLAVLKPIFDTIVVVRVGTTVDLVVKVTTDP